MLIVFIGVFITRFALIMITEDRLMNKYDYFMTLISFILVIGLKMIIIGLFN